MKRLNLLDCRDKFESYIFEFIHYKLYYYIDDKQKQQEYIDLVSVIRQQMRYNYFNIS